MRRIGKRNRVVSSRVMAETASRPMRGHRYIKADREIFDNEQIYDGREYRNSMIKKCQDIEDIFYKIKMVLTSVDDYAFNETGWDADGDEAGNPLWDYNKYLGELKELIEKVDKTIFSLFGYSEIDVDKYAKDINDAFYQWMNELKGE